MAKDTAETKDSPATADKDAIPMDSGNGGSKEETKGMQCLGAPTETTAAATATAKAAKASAAAAVARGVEDEPPEAAAGDGRDDGREAVPKAAEENKSKRKRRKNKKKRRRDIAAGAPAATSASTARSYAEAPTTAVANSPQALTNDASDESVRVHKRDDERAGRQGGDPLTKLKTSPWQHSSTVKKPQTAEAPMTAGTPPKTSPSPLPSQAHDNHSQVGILHEVRRSPLLRKSQPTIRRRAPLSSPVATPPASAQKVRSLQPRACAPGRCSTGRRRVVERRARRASGPRRSHSRSRVERAGCNERPEPPTGDSIGHRAMTMEEGGDSGARWLYCRCSAARVAMESTLTPLQLSVLVLRFVKSADEDSEDIDQMELSRVLKEEGKAKRQDLNFVYEIKDRAEDLRDDVDLSEEALMAVAAENADTASNNERVDEEDTRASGSVMSGCNVNAGADSADGEDPIDTPAAENAGTTTSNNERVDEEHTCASGSGMSGDNVNAGADSADGEDPIDTPAAVNADATLSNNERVDEEHTCASGSGAGGDDGKVGADSDDGDDQMDAPAVEEQTSEAEGRKPPVSFCEAASLGNDDGNQDINVDELRCDQLRRRVHGLARVSFNELWRDLQAAGWTHSSGKYHIPKGIRQNWLHSNIEDRAKRIYTHFNLDSKSNQKEAPQLEEEGRGIEEEGPETFDTSNKLVDYLDQSCLSDYRLTRAEVHAQQAAFSSKSKAYQRRNKRLRFELLEIVHRKTTTPKAEQHDANASVFAKYGHTHRPCEVCFMALYNAYPLVACRVCGLVVHTHCYGLLDHGEGDTPSSNCATKSDVDAKGFFTCDVCANSFGRKTRNSRWNAPQSSGWRVHEQPNVVCPICDKNHIAGAMVRITIENQDDVKKSRKRKSRRSTESSEHWVHLFCINSLSHSEFSPDSVRSSGDALDLAVRYSELETTVRCAACASRKGDLVQCLGTCERFFHQLCLQVDCLDPVGGDSKKEHFCLRCRSTDQQKNHSHEVIADSSSGFQSVSTIERGTLEAIASRDKDAEEIQYFDRNSGKTSSRNEGGRSILDAPSQQDSIAAIESLHRSSEADVVFDDFECQYRHQFREWSFSLATNQSILLYGLGSKTSLLTSFGKYLSAEGDVVSLNGYDPNIDVEKFLGCLGELLIDGMKQSNPQPTRKNAATMAKKFASARSRPLFLLIHNIDGVGLRTHLAQDTIATLTTASRKDGSPMIRVAASVDNVNAAMVLWSPEIERKFDWTRKQVHTFRPYLEEVRHLPQAESSKKAKKIAAGGLKDGSTPAVLKALVYLAPKHTEVLQSLASLQLSSSSQSVSYQMLRDECARKTLTASDSVLRSIMKELLDHKIIGLRKDDEGIEQIFVPLSIPLKDILDFNPKSS